MGHRIELGEIESASLKCNGVRRAACVYASESKRIALFYLGDVDENALLSELSLYLPRYMLPNIIKKLEIMPLTDNGKTDRRGLRETAENM